MSRIARWFAALALLAGLASRPDIARAQDDLNAIPGEEEEGDPLFGYLGTGFLACGALFVLCKSARR